MSARMSRGCYEETAPVEFKLNNVFKIKADRPLTCDMLNDP